MTSGFSIAGKPPPFSRTIVQAARLHGIVIALSGLPSLAGFTLPPPIVVTACMNIVDAHRTARREKPDDATQLANRRRDRRADYSEAVLVVLGKMDSTDRVLLIAERLRDLKSTDRPWRHLTMC